MPEQSSVSRQLRSHGVRTRAALDAEHRALARANNVQPTLDDVVREFELLASLIGSSRTSSESSESFHDVADMPPPAYTSVGKEFVKPFKISAPEPEKEYQRFFRTVECFFAMNKVADDDESFKFNFTKLALGADAMDAIETRNPDEWDTYAKLKEVVKDRFVATPSELYHQTP